MANVAYEPTWTMRDARAAYFAANAFGEDGGYGAAWAEVKLGPVPFPIPNTPSRVRALRYHDLHHVLTGYATDIVGEFEISAWELGAGCRDFAFAWAINLAGIGGGLLVAPRRTWRAFVRGRRSRSLYGQPLDELLETTVAEARVRVGVAERGSARASDVAAFALAAVGAAVVGTAFFLTLVPLAPIGFVALTLARRRAEALLPRAED